MRKAPIALIDKVAALLLNFHLFLYEGGIYISTVTWHLYWISILNLMFNYEL